jgi:hypothetical protein
MPWPEEYADTVLYGEREFIGDKDLTLRMVDGARTDLFGDFYINGEKYKQNKDQIFTNVKDFGAKGDRVADDTAAILAAIDFCYANGGGEVVVPTGIYKISAPILVPGDVSLRGVGGGWAKLDGSTRPMTIFKCNSADSKIIVEGSGGPFGNFAIDGCDIANGPLLHRRGVAAKRLFQCIFMGRSKLEAMRVDEAQNDVFIDLSMFWNAGSGLVLDKGCGGLAFYGCEFGGCGNWHLIITETAGTGPYSAPSHNTFDHCLFELPPTGVTSLPGCISIRTGQHNTFRDCASNASTALPTVALMEINGTALGNDPTVTLDGFWFANSTAGATGIVQSAGDVWINGYTEFTSLLHAWKFNGGVVNVHGYIMYNGVTNRWDPAGTGDIRALALTRNTRGFRAQVESTDFFGLRVYQFGDTGSRLDIGPDGRLNWGAGVSSTDTTLTRQSANVLSTGAIFRFGNFTTALRLTAAGSGKGAVCFDSTLNILIYIHGTIWRKVSDDTPA